MQSLPFWHPLGFQNHAQGLHVPLACEYNTSLGVFGGAFNLGEPSLLTVRALSAVGDISSKPKLPMTELRIESSSDRHVVNASCSGLEQVVDASCSDVDP
jgi:hypothetical protein